MSHSRVSVVLSAFGRPQAIVLNCRHCGRELAGALIAPGRGYDQARVIAGAAASGDIACTRCCPHDGAWLWRELTKGADDFQRMPEWARPVVVPGSPTHEEVLP